MTIHSFNSKCSDINIAISFPHLSYELQYTLNTSNQTLTTKSSN